MAFDFYFLFKMSLLFLPVVTATFMPAGQQLKRATEAAYIRLKETTNTRAGFYILAKSTARMILH